MKLYNISIYYLLNHGIFDKIRMHSSDVSCGIAVFPLIRRFISLTRDLASSNKALLDSMRFATAANCILTNVKLW